MMMRKILFMVLLAFSVSTEVNAQKYTGDSGEIETILSKIRMFSEAYMSADYDALARMYTEDAMIMPPGAEIISGRSAIKKRWTLPEGIQIKLHKVTPVEIEIVDNTAYDLGTYEGITRRADNTEVAWKGKYIIIWKKVGDDWLIYADAWNRIDDQ